jgi:hypothetical protein
MTQFQIGDTAGHAQDGRFSLNDFHKASGGELKNRPVEFMRLEQIKALIAEMEKVGIPTFKVQRGATGGTYACRELVIAYAAWISPAFHLKVLRVFLDSTVPALPGKLLVDAERLALAHSLAAQAVAKVSESVFEAVLANPCTFWKHDRYLLSFDYSPSNLPVFTPKVSVVDKHAFVMTLERLARAISDPDHLADDAELIRLAAACCQRLANRAGSLK